VLIAQAVFRLERGQTDRQTDATDPIQAGGYAGVGEERHRSKTRLHTNNVQSVADGVSWQTNFHHASLTSIDPTVEIDEAFCHNLLLLSQLLMLVSSSFSRIVSDPGQ